MFAFGSRANTRFARYFPNYYGLLLSQHFWFEKWLSEGKYNLEIYSGKGVIPGIWPWDFSWKDKLFEEILFYPSMSMSKDKSKNNADQREANCRISKQLVIDGCVY